MYGCRSQLPDERRPTRNLSMRFLERRYNIGDMAVFSTKLRGAPWGTEGGCHNTREGVS